MPQLRKDPIRDRWVIIATDRANRPNQFDAQSVLSRRGPCPFCAGNEDMTPPEILARRPHGSEKSSWTLRVVPNKFPALITEAGLKPCVDGIYDFVNGFGAHEVIIETPRHESNMSALTDVECEDAVAVYQERVSALKKDRRFRHILIFKNQGAAAGATIEHAHSQLIALPLVPQQIVEELSSASIHYQSKGQCVYCDIVSQELKQGSRVVIEGDLFLVVCPFASRVPFETWILPKCHSPYFENAPEGECAELARVLKATLRRLNRALSYPSFNSIIHSMPFDAPGREYYHWHIEILPKLARVAGFEWGSGFYINPVTPEAAALSLRVEGEKPS
ncbi:MAG: galactose-1-phosphate uridylyltransferase [Candidatus Binatia bacterium]